MEAARGDGSAWDNHNQSWDLEVISHLLTQSIGQK